MLPHRRIVVRVIVVQTAFLGDMVLTTPLLREIKRSHPGVPVSVVAAPSGARVLAGHPFVDRVMTYDKRGADRGLIGLWRQARFLRSVEPDIVIAAQKSSRTGLLGLLSGAKRRIGFAGAPGAWAYTDRVLWTESIHAVYRYVALAGPAGGDPSRADPHPLLGVLPEAAAIVEADLVKAGHRPGERPVVLSPGSMWGTKRWFPEGFAAVARAVREWGEPVVVAGSPDERDLCEGIARLAGGGIPVLAGNGGIPGLTALLARSRALVANDSRPGHVASAVRTPVVSIFGPTVPAFGYAPFGESNRIVEIAGLECRPCDRHGPQVCPLGHHRCMKEIAPERVLFALSEILGRRVTPAVRIQ
jgi:heptosyltransferase-2